MKRILLPTDFSKNAWNAISYAMEFFKEEKCTFYLLHTYTPVYHRMDYVLGVPAFTTIPDSGVDTHLAALDKTFSEVKKKFKNPLHHFKKLSAFNQLSDEINEVAEREGIDMVVMGTQGATGAKKIFMGTNTVYVIRKSKVPVLVIPENYKFNGVQKILFPSNYLTLYKPKELRPIIEIAKAQKAQITVLYVLEESELDIRQEENKEFLRECLEEVAPMFMETRTEYMPDAIHNYVRDNSIDLLAMMNPKHSFMERLLLQQNVDEIGFQVEIPFLVIRDTAK
ncbi:universal stress protein [Maribacter arcticus]|uniref:Nucleotide-binding universal stress protein, UspA family n=1 Tax=Maribacter arcticus TaxID=561365 RepID=A0A1T5CIT3_9FLAO|nr:universal stress protein [Maribacter arcticus]SKB59050.1 Nucleotide-binding universal stress protein, UspA family [Maribacter arcticus]